MPFGAGFEIDLDNCDFASLASYALGSGNSVSSSPLSESEFSGAKGDPFIDKRDSPRRGGLGIFGVGGKSGLNMWFCGRVCPSV